MRNRCSGHLLYLKNLRSQYLPCHHAVALTNSFWCKHCFSINIHSFKRYGWFGSFSFASVFNLSQRVFKISPAHETKSFPENIGCCTGIYHQCFSDQSSTTTHRVEEICELLEIWIQQYPGSQYFAQRSSKSFNFIAPHMQWISWTVKRDFHLIIEYFNIEFYIGIISIYIRSPTFLSVNLSAIASLTL